MSRHVQPDQMQSLASRTPASGPARQKVLQAAAAEASNADEFKPEIDSSSKKQKSWSQLELMSQQMARMEEVLQEVMAYKQLVSTPQRATATPAAAVYASFTEDRLAVSCCMEAGSR